MSDPPKTVRILYKDGKGEVSGREVEPYEIKNECQPNETLYAHCLARDALRQFKLEQILSVSVGKPFKPRHAITLT